MIRVCGLLQEHYPGNPKGCSRPYDRPNICWVLERNTHCAARRPQGIIQYRERFETDEQDGLTGTKDVNLPEEVRSEMIGGDVFLYGTVRWLLRI